MNHPADNPRQSGPVAVAEVLFENTARLIEMQASLVEAWMRLPGQAASLYGGPDWTGLVPRDSVRQVSNLFTTSAGQALTLMRQCESAFRTINRQITAAMTEQATQYTAQVNASMQAFGDAALQAARELRKQSGQSAIEVVPHHESERARTRRTAESRSQ